MTEKPKHEYQYRGFCEECSRAIRVSIIRVAGATVTEPRVWVRCRSCNGITRIPHETTKPAAVTEEEPA